MYKEQCTKTEFSFKKDTDQPIGNTTDTNG